MSNSLAIATVTATLRSLLAAASSSVTILPPDRAARDTTTSNRLNLFLYHTLPNAGWRNMDLASTVRPGERGRPPLALNLFYLLTAYGEDDIAAHRVLGDAMSVLHDRAILRDEDVRQTIKHDRTLAESDLDRQVEHVRLSQEPMSLEEMSKLWSTFQTQYRMSVAYQATVVLIDSKRPTSTPLPVLMRGEGDRGVISDLGIDPLLESIEYRSEATRPSMPAARVGDVITLRGPGVRPTPGLKIVVRDRAQTALGEDDLIAELAPLANGAPADGVRVRLTDSNRWTAGQLSLELSFPRPSDGPVDPAAPAVPPLVSNALPLLIAPTIRFDGDKPLTSLVEVDGRRILNVSLDKRLSEQRRPSLLLNRGAAFHSVAAQEFAQWPDENVPAFDVTSAPSGRYRFRVRVDGIDSFVMSLEPDEHGKIRPVMDTRLQVDI